MNKNIIYIIVGVLVIGIIIKIIFGGGPQTSAHDQTFNFGGSVSKSHSKVEKDYCTSEIRSDIALSPITNWNVVIDMSAGLNEGISQTRDVAMEHILDKTLSKAHFYKVALKIEDLSFTDENDLFSKLMNQNSYGGKWSKLKPGLRKATEDFSTPSLFVTDFLLDEGGSPRTTQNISNKGSKTTSKVDYGWASDEGFTEWLDEGNSIHFFIYPYIKTTSVGKVETNLYYCFFIPKNIDFKSSELFKDLTNNLSNIKNASYLPVEPLNVDLSFKKVFDEHINLSHNQYSFSYNDDESNLSVFQYLMNTSLFNNEASYTYLDEPIDIHNKSPWKLDLDISNSDDFLNLQKFGSTNPSSNGGVDMSSISTLPGYSSFATLKTDNKSVFIEFDKTAGNGFNLGMITQPTYFFSKHIVNIDELSLSEQFKIDAKKLECVIYADGHKFQHKSLYKSIIGSLQEISVKQSAKEILSTPYFYKSYSITSISI